MQVNLGSVFAHTHLNQGKIVLEMQYSLMDTSCRAMDRLEKLQKQSAFLSAILEMFCGAILKLESQTKL